MAEGSLLITRSRSHGAWWTRHGGKDAAERDGSEDRHRRLRRARRQDDLEEGHGVTEPRLQGPEGAVTPPDDEGHALEREGADAREQAPVAPPREGAPPDVGQAGEAHHGPRGVRDPKGLRAARELAPRHGPRMTRRRRVVSVLEVRRLGALRRPARDLRRSRRCCTCPGTGPSDETTRTWTSLSLAGASTRQPGRRPCGTDANLLAERGHGIAT